MDADAIHDPGMGFLLRCLAGGWFPPPVAGREELLRAQAGGGIFVRIRQLFVRTEHEHRRPVRAVVDLFDLEADQGIGAHPVDLLPDRREAVDVAAIDVKRHRDDVRLAVLDTGQPGEIVAVQHLEAFLSAEFVNQHSARSMIRPHALAVAIGASALALTRTVSGLRFGVTPTDPVTFVGVLVMLMVVALLACSIPARRAMGVQPIEAPRETKPVRRQPLTN